MHSSSSAVRENAVRNYRIWYDNLWRHRLRSTSTNHQRWCTNTADRREQEFWQQYSSNNAISASYPQLAITKKLNSWPCGSLLSQYCDYAPPVKRCSQRSRHHLQAQLPSRRQYDDPLSSKFFSSQTARHISSCCRRLSILVEAPTSSQGTGMSSTDSYDSDSYAKQFVHSVQNDEIPVVSSVDKNSVVAANTIRRRNPNLPRADSRQVKSSLLPPASGIDLTLQASPVSDVDAASSSSLSPVEDDSNNTTTIAGSLKRRRHPPRYYSPLQELNQFYRTRLGLPNTKGYFALETVRITGAASNAVTLPLVPQKKIKVPVTTDISTDVDNKNKEVDDRLISGSSNKLLVYEVWCAAFTCPLTQRIFLSGTLHGSPFDISSQNDRASISTNGNDENSKIEKPEPDMSLSSTGLSTSPFSSPISPMVIITGKGDRRVFYSKKNLAVQAAAGRAMDVLQWEHLGIAEPRFCLEPPHNYQTDMTASITRDNATVVNSSINSEAAATNAPGIVINLSPPVATNISIKHELEEVDTFALESKETIYTTTNPTVCDNLREADGPSAIPTDQTSGPMMNAITISGTSSADPEISSPKSNEARELLIIGDNRLGVQGEQKELQSSLVTESVGDSGSAEKVGTVSSDGPLIAPSGLSGSTEAYDALVDNDSDDDEESMYESSSSLVTESIDEDSDEQEYILATLVTPRGLPPAARILDCLTSQASPVNATSHGPVPFGMPAKTTPYGELMAAIELANAWVSTHQHEATDEPRSNPHRLVIRKKDPSTILPMAKLVLSRLSQSNQLLTAPQVKGVQAAADRILDLLWETNDSKPDADTMALYLKCLEGNDIKEVALRAKEIVQDMKEARLWKGGRVLPSPNVRTIGALIQVHAQMGGATGRYRDVDDSFQPDRVSFLSLLSSATYIPVVPGDQVGFDPEFASRCVARMEELAEKDPRLQPATDVYNAPLRWCGGAIFHHSRPYARAVPWDKYYKMFRRESIPEKASELDQFYVTAKAMDKWLHEMESKGDPQILPNIETYEAVIQAWLRVVSHEGIMRAEQRALKLLDKQSGSIRVVPRLQTYHPILASLLFANESDAPVRIAQWIHRLESASVEIPELRPDGRMLEALISSLVSKQSSLMATSSPNQVDDAVLQELFGVASQCSDVLNKACSRLTSSISNNGDPDIFLEAGIFAMTITAWQNLVKEANDTGRVEMVERSLQEIFRIVSQFEGTIQAVAAAETTNSIGLSSHREYSRQLQHLIGHSGYVYSTLIDTLRTIMVRRDSSNNHRIEYSCYQPLFLTWVERSVRRTAEFIEIESREFLMGRAKDSNNIQPVSDHAEIKEGSVGLYYDNERWCPWRVRVTYDDYFSYRPDDAPKPSKLSYLWRTSDFLKDVASSTSYDNHSQMGDLARIGGLIKQVCGAVGTFNRLVRSIDETLDGLMMKRTNATDEVLPKVEPQLLEQRNPQPGGRPYRSSRLTNMRTSTSPRPKLRAGRRPTLARVKQIND